MLGAALVKRCSPPLGAHQQRPAYALRKLWWPHGILAAPRARGSWGCPGVGLGLLSAGAVGQQPSGPPQRGLRTRSLHRRGLHRRASQRARGRTGLRCVCPCLSLPVQPRSRWLSVLLQQRCADILEFSAVVGWPINRGNFRNNYSDGSKQAPQKDVALPALTKPLFAKRNAWQSVVLPDPRVLHLELPDDLARARAAAVFALGAMGMPRYNSIKAFVAWAQQAGRAVGVGFFFPLVSPPPPPLAGKQSWQSILCPRGVGAGGGTALARSGAAPWLRGATWAEAQPRGGQERSGTLPEAAASPQPVSPPALPAVARGCLHARQRGTGRRVHNCPQVSLPPPVQRVPLVPPRILQQVPTLSTSKRGSLALSGGCRPGQIAEALGASGSAFARRCLRAQHSIRGRYHGDGH